MRPAVLALAALVLVLAPGSAATASPHVRYGVQDDAWIVDGPGTLAARLDRLRALGVEAVRFNLRWDEIARKRPANPRNPDDPAYRWGAADAVSAGLLLQLRAGEQVDVRRLRLRRRAPLPARPRLADLERAQPPGVVPAGLAAPLHRAPERRPRRHPPGEPARARRRRGDRPARERRRRLPARLDRGHGARARAPRRLRAQPPPVAPAGGDPVLRRLRPLPHDHDGDPGRLLRAVRSAFAAKTRVWLTEYGYQTDPPDHFLGVSWALQARYVGEAALRAFLAPRVDLPIHFMVRDDTRLGPARLTSPRGFFERDVRAGAGSRLRVWSPRDHVFGAAVVVR